MTWQERFWKRVNKNGPVPMDKPELGPCWVWITPTSREGYGNFKFKGRKMRAHRFIYEQKVGPIPSSKQCDHLCRNRACVNYRHIELVTPRENIRRGVSSRKGLPVIDSWAWELHVEAVGA